MIRRLIILLLLFASLILPTILYAQDTNTTSEELMVGSVGLLAEDGSVFYSVLLGNGSANALSELTITSVLPEGAAFVEAFWTPEDAVFMGEENGIITWTLPEMPADSIVGPFTYRVTFDETDAAIPTNVAATAAWNSGEVVAQLSEDELLPYDDSGSITVDAAGADGLIPVGNTGVYLLIPPGAVDQPVTFTFDRQAISEDSDLPPVPEGESIWWCTLFQLSVEPTEIEISQPIYVLFPIQRTLTPGMEVINFIRPTDGSWTTGETAQVSPNGSHIIVPLTDLASISNISFTAGVPTQLRVAATVTNFSTQLKTPGWVDPDIDPWVDPDPQP